MAKRLENSLWTQGITTNCFNRRISSCQERKDEDFYLCRTAAFWHDTGRKDWEDEIVPHHTASADLFMQEASEIGLLEATSNVIKEMILSHRRRCSDNSIPDNYLMKILWDADKLDIININRINELLFYYQNGISSGEFNIHDSTQYWDSIVKNSLEGELFFEKSKELYKQRFLVFQNKVKEIYELSDKHN